MVPIASIFADDFIIVDVITICGIKNFIHGIGPEMEIYVVLFLIICWDDVWQIKPAAFGAAGVAISGSVDYIIYTDGGGLLFDLSIGAKN